MDGMGADARSGGGMSAEQKPTSVLEGTAVVWKFPVVAPDAHGRSFIDAPAEAELLSVGVQDDVIVVWALTESLNALHRYRLIVANTGMSIPEFPPSACFLGTVTTSNGIVWHIWRDA